MPISLKKFAVIDIGSNSVRMIVYRQGALALPLFNEKASCCLGKDLSKTGMLHKKGVVEAALLLQRFAHLARAMQVEKITAVATQAVRKAENGKDFLRQLNKKTGIKIKILSGKQEAAFSAQGLLAAFPGANGIMGDMGGGSLELAALGNGKSGKKASLPFGAISLIDSPLSLAALRRHVSSEYKALSWLKRAGKGKTFYAIGGTFRALARLHMLTHGYPLHVVHHYTVDAAAMTRFLRACALGKMQRQAARHGIAKSRIPMMPLAAMALLELLRAGGFKNICFSTFGLREGVAVSQHKSKAARGDILIETCKALALRAGRFGMIGDEVFEFLSPLIKSLRPDSKRLVHAACWISDIGWADHPEERAQQIFHRILHAPLLALDHPSRCFLALCCHARYAGKAKDLGEMIRLLPRGQTLLAMRIGIALRFADTICGGAAGVLPDLDFGVKGRMMELSLPKHKRVGGGEEVPKRFEALAKAFGKSPIIVQA